MINEYTLEKLCQKYSISSDKLVTRNNNILAYGQYNDIDETLDYLINQLHIDISNIEKCSSILYRNVELISSNVAFLKRQNISFSSIESCLHVLSSDPNQLAETYEYLLENYGISLIEKKHLCFSLQ